MRWFDWLRKKPQVEYDAHDFCETVHGVQGQSAYYVRPCEMDEQLIIYSIDAGYDREKLGTLELREGGKAPRVYPVHIDKTVTFDPPLILDWGCALQLQLTAGGTAILAPGSTVTIQSSITVHGCHVKPVRE